MAQVAKYQFPLAVKPDHPAKTLGDFVAWAKANPAEANFGTGGVGSIPHLIGVMVNRATGTALVHVPYKGLALVESELIGG